MLTCILSTPQIIKTHSNPTFYSYRGKHIVFAFCSKHYANTPMQYIEIIICQFSYHTRYQPETTISARDSRISPRPKVRGLIRESRADVGVEG